jgi:cytochrome c551/c552
MVCFGQSQSAPQLSQTIEKLKALKPDNIELSPILIYNGQIKIEGYATNTRFIPIYFHSIEESKIGLVQVKEIMPVERDGRHVIHFKIIVAPQESGLLTNISTSSRVSETATGVTKTEVIVESPPRQGLHNSSSSIVENGTASPILLFDGLKFKSMDDLYKYTAAQKWSCTACHSLEYRTVGPSFLEISRHSEVNDVNRIVKVIHEGSTNSFGTIPMPPIRGVPEAEAKMIAEWILSLDNKLVVSDADQKNQLTVSGPSSHTPSSSPMQNQPQEFITFSPDPAKPWQSKTAWWLLAEFHPNSKTIREIPVNKIDSGWCYANEFAKELFPLDVLGGFLGLNEILQERNSFSITRKFDGINKITVLVGVYQTCEKKTGTFLIGLNNSKKNKQVVFLEKFDTPFFAFLSNGNKQSFELWDCYACDGNLVYEWNKSSRTFVKKNSDE